MVCVCAPELTRGLCQICTGTLTPETTHVDRFGNAWDVHKGVCAILAGDSWAVPFLHRPSYHWLLAQISKASTSEVRRIKIKTFNKWVRQVADEDHYHYGP